MRISFDIDNTLIPISNEFEVLEPNSLFKYLNNEKIRKGTINLFRKLSDRGFEIWIYTTSLRSKINLKLIFAQYGLYPKGFINEKLNQEVLKLNNLSCSKNPNLFNIDFHVDDSLGVLAESKKYEFNCVYISPNDLDWTNTLLTKLDDLVNGVERRLLNCPTCNNENDVISVLRNGSLSWPNRNWVLSKCTECDSRCHLKILNGQIEIGLVDGGPGPIIRSYGIVTNERIEIKITTNSIICNYNNEIYKFKAKQKNEM